MDYGYIVGSKRYCPDKSELLCSCFTEVKTTISLYLSPKGQYFTVEDTGFLSESRFTLFDESKAMKFMDEHPEGIEQETYIRLFGEPEEG